MNDPQPAAITFASAGQAEELERAELYGLLARLWLAPPDAELMQAFRVAVTQAPQTGGHLEGPWQDMVAALRATTVDAAATEHEAPEHEPPERRPEERKYTLSDVQRALRISVARPKLTGRAKPGIRSWRGRSSRAVAAGARCRSRAHVAGWRGRWQCTATRHSLPAARAAAARRTRCWLRVRRRLPPAARPPHARRLSVRHRLPPESKALPSRASVRRAEWPPGEARCVSRARASPPPKSRAAACVSVSYWCVCSHDILFSQPSTTTLAAPPESGAAAVAGARARRAR